MAADASDVATTDLGTADLGTADVGLTDLGLTDLGLTDLGPGDVRTLDVGIPDVGIPDVGIPDVGIPDVGIPDVGVPDVVDASGSDARDVTIAVDVPTGGCAVPTAAISLPGPEVSFTGTTRGASAIGATRCQPAASGPENVYSLTITSPTGVLIDTENSATRFNTILSIRRTCSDPAAEVACDDDNGDTPESSSRLRTALEPGTYSLIVDGADDAAGSYALRARFYDVAPNAFCAGATVLTAATPIVQTLPRSGGPSTACLVTGGQLFYRHTLAPGTVSKIEVWAQDSSLMFSPTLQVLDACGATTCVAADAGGSVVWAEATLTNPTSSARTYILAVAPVETTATTGTFEISAVSTPLVPTAICQTAVALAVDGVAVSGNSTLGAARGARCNTTSESGREVFYTVDLPPGRRVTVRAQPQAGATWRPRIRAFDACDSTTCRTTALTSTGGGATTLNLDNPSQRVVTMRVSVASTSSATGGPFDLSATSAPLSLPPMPYYTLTTIPGACDDVRAGAPIYTTSSRISPATSPLAPLPWTFRFFGANEAYFSVASTGFAQLWPSTVGSPSSAYSPSRFPDPIEPNNMIAPFWDDLRYVDSSTGVRALSLGAAPARRFVIQWANWQGSRPGTSDSDRLTFQAKLFETTGVIEFHYCTLRPATSRNTGALATVGIENAGGDLGNLVHYRAADGISTDTAFRLTPPGTP